MQTDYNNVFPDLYKIQLTEGCISFRCKNKHCKSCANFIYSSETSESLCEKAKTLALNHSRNNLLCSNFPPTLFDFSIFENVLIFNDFLSDFIHHRKFPNTAKITSILSNLHSYPFLFSYDLNEIDFYSIHPPPDLIQDFVLTEKSNSEDLDFLRKSHNDMVDILISDSPNIIPQIDSLYHLRAIYVSFLFYTLFSQNQQLLLALIKHTMSLLPEAHLLLSDIFSKSPLLINELNSAVQDAISNYIKRKSCKMDRMLWDASKFIHFILVPANNKSSKPISYRSFTNKDISKNFLAKIELRRFISSRPTFLHTPSVINLIKKSRLLPEGNIITSSNQKKLSLVQVNSSFKYSYFTKDDTPDTSFDLEEEDLEEEEEECFLEEEDNDDDESKDSDIEEESKDSDSNTDEEESFSGNEISNFLISVTNSNSRRNNNRNTSENSGNQRNSSNSTIPSFLMRLRERFQRHTNENTRSNIRNRRRPNSSFSSSSNSSSSSDSDNNSDDEIDTNFDSYPISDDSDEYLGEGNLNIKVRRDHLLDDTLVALLTADQKQLMGRVKVQFHGEEAYDAGGVSREFFTLVTSTLFSPDYGMFELINDRFYWFRNSSENGDLSRYYKLFGAFIGIAINNKVILPIRFPLLMYKKLLNYKNSVFDISDFAEIDPVVAQSLQSLIEIKERGENVEDSGLMFDFSYEYFDTVQTKELIENGSNIPVTNDNLDKYIEKVIDWKLNKSIESQFMAFKEGYDMNCNTPIMRLFAPVELDELISGLEKLDWEAFKKSVTYSGYNKNSQTIKDLWQIMDHEWDEKQKKDFLYFITGIKTAPVGGLGQLKITIERDGKSNQLPTSHTCFNELILPNYKDINVLRQKLAICLENCEGFGLV